MTHATFIECPHCKTINTRKILLDPMGSKIVEMRCSSCKKPSFFAALSVPLFQIRLSKLEKNDEGKFVIAEVTK